MTPQALWAALSAPQRARLSRYDCKGCKRTLRRTLTDGCDCDVVGNVSDCLAASPHAHIKEVPPGGPFTSPARPTPSLLSGSEAFIPYPLDALGFLAAAGRADNAQATTPRSAPDNSGYAGAEVFHSQVAV